MHQYYLVAALFMMAEASAQQANLFDTERHLKSKPPVTSLLQPPAGQLVKDTTYYFTGPGATKQQLLNKGDVVEYGFGKMPVAKPGNTNLYSTMPNAAANEKEGKLKERAQQIPNAAPRQQENLLRRKIILPAR